MYRLLVLLTVFLPFALFALVDDVSISANPGGLNITTATAGSQPDNALDSGTTIRIETNFSAGPRHVTAQIDSNMPSGLQLTVSIAEPPGNATSTGAQLMTTTAIDVVQNIPSNTTLSNLSITYTLSATVSAGTVSSTQRTVTFTLV